MQIHPALFKKWCVSFYKRHFSAGSSSPKPIELFPGETEIFRKGTVLVTNTRLAYIDPNDRMFKTYMFEHMISLHKNYYRATPVNRLFCKVLLLTSTLMLVVAIAIDIFKETSQNYAIVYLPIMLGFLIGMLVWRDMRPRYTMQWKMRDGTEDKISTEPMYREWLLGKSQREEFMDGLAQAMNQAISAKSWWPGNNNSDPASSDDTSEDPEHSETGKPRLRLVTDNYQ